MYRLLSCLISVWLIVRETLAICGEGCLICDGKDSCKLCDANIPRTRRWILTAAAICMAVESCLFAAAPSDLEISSIISKVSASSRRSKARLTPST